MASRFFNIMRMSAFNSKTISKILSLPPLGRLAFRVSIGVKRLSLLYGSWSQRAVEYPWVLEQLRLLKPGSLILDVGCAESLLSHELIARKFRVGGLDIREYPFKNKWMLFMKRNILNTSFPDNLFDAILVVSTIEHVGLSVYGQIVHDEEADIKAVRELYRMLKPKGIIITTPFIGGEPFRILQGERNYNWERLRSIFVKEAILLKDEYFYPIKYKKRSIWIKLKREQAIKKAFPRSGIACIILQKPTCLKK